MFISGWSAERTERCRQMAADGYTAGQIAAEIHLTRNAVIGKIKRMKWPWRNARNNGGAMALEEKINRQKKRKLKKRGFFKVKTPLTADGLPAPAPFRASEISRMSYAATGPKSLLDLNSVDCKWPVCDDGGFVFCAAARENEFNPYCVHHNGIAFEGTKKRSATGEFTWRKNINGSPQASPSPQRSANAS